MERALALLAVLVITRESGKPARVVPPLLGDHEYGVYYVPAGRGSRVIFWEYAALVAMLPEIHTLIQRHEGESR